MDEESITFDDVLFDRLVDGELSAAERRTVAGYLAKHADRADAVRDVVWAVVNTCEFLLQH